MAGSTAGLLSYEGHETQMSVVNAFEKLLGEKRIDDITVNAICKEAGISRATFYYHFKDKADICQWHYGYVAERFLFQTGRTMNWQQANYLNTLEFARHETLYRWCFDQSGYASLFEHAKRRRIETLRETVTDYKHARLDPELEFQIVALADAEVGGVAHWFINGMPYDVKTLSIFLDSVVPRRLYDLLNDPVDDSLSPIIGWLG